MCLANLPRPPGRVAIACAKTIAGSSLETNTSEHRVMAVTPVAVRMALSGRYATAAMLATAMMAASKRSAIAMDVRMTNPR